MGDAPKPRPWPTLRPVREAFTPELRYLENKVVWAIRLALVALAIYSLTVQPRYTTKPLLFLSAVSGLLFSLGFAFVPTRRPRTLKAAEAAVLVEVAAHVGGHALGLYQNLAWYDTMLHFTMPFVTVLVLYALSQATDWIWVWTEVSPLEVAVYLFSMTVALGTMWEILEFGMDRIFGTREQDDLPDTMIDLIAGVLGALLGAVAAGLVTRYGRAHGEAEVSEEPKRPVPMRGPSRRERRARGG